VETPKRATRILAGSLLLVVFALTYWVGSWAGDDPDRQKLRDAVTAAIWGVALVGVLLLSGVARWDLRRGTPRFWIAVVLLAPAGVLLLIVVVNAIALLVGRAW
jgi:hypothetical protein